MKLVMLDMDGVLNRGSDNCSPNRYMYKDRFSAVVGEGDHTCEMTYVDPELAKRLSKTIEDFDLYIVASSSWRLFYKEEDYKELLKLRFLPGDRLVGYTPNFYRESTFFGGGPPRWMEIRAFLREFKEPVEKCVILDDLGEAEPRPGELPNAKFFKCDFDFGYTEKIDKQVRKWLEG